MKVLVAVKEVETVEDDFEIDGLAIDSRYLEPELNEWDEYAIEEAVQLLEADIAEEVVTVTIGPDSHEQTIRQALAKGADRAIRIWDDTIAAIDFLDVGAKVMILNAVIEAEEPDLVLTGVQASDDSFMATGVGAAAAAGYQWGAVVNALDIDSDAGTASVRRELEGGVEEETEIPLPAVLTIQTGINEPRYASLRGIRMAQQKDLEHRTLADLGVDESAIDRSLELISMAEPESTADTTVFDGSPEEAATQLAGLLADMGVGK